MKYKKTLKRFEAKHINVCGGQISNSRKIGKLSKKKKSFRNPFTKTIANFTPLKKI